MKPRALALLSRLPWPLDDGGRVGLYQIAWSLSRYFDTVMVALVPPGEVSAPLPAAIAELGARMVRVAHRPPSNGRALAEGLLGRWPYTLARFRNAEFDRVVRREVAEFQPDFVHLSSLHMATYSAALAGIPKVLREQNLEHLWLRRLASTFTNPLTRAYTSFQAVRLERAEAELCAHMDLVLAIHDHEAAQLRSLAPRTRVEVVPIGIDPARFGPRAPAAAPTVLVTGAFGWAPNLLGLRRFLERGWPVLRGLSPGAALRVVGRDLPVESLCALAGERAELAGYVERIEPEFARAALLLVPLWVGAGARIKIVEALMAGTPVVSTPLGAEGLGLNHGREVILAESPEDLARAAADLLANPARAAALGDAGRRFALAHFSLEAVAARTCDLIRPLIDVTPTPVAHMTPCR
ncbi:MAG: glycosyltransferase family 4 protein [Candidatus Eiseniibacteriota bacterium]